MKVAENSPQNAQNCTIFKNFLGGACPQTPPSKDSDSDSEKIILHQLCTSELDLLWRRSVKVVQLIY